MVSDLLLAFFFILSQDAFVSYFFCLLANTARTQLFLFYFDWLLSRGWDRGGLLGWNCRSILIMSLTHQKEKIISISFIKSRFSIHLFLFLKQQTNLLSSHEHIFKLHIPDAYNKQAFHAKKHFPLPHLHLHLIELNYKINNPKSLQFEIELSACAKLSISSLAKQLSIYKVHEHLQIISMQDPGLGLFSRTVRSLTETLFHRTTLKRHSGLLAAAQALGLPIREDYSTERIVFTASQVIANLLDEIVCSEKQSRKRTLEHSLQGHSTLNSGQSCMAGNFHIAAQIFSIFCPKLPIWDILQCLAELKQELEREDPILENVSLSQRVFYLPNHRHSFRCHCSIFNEEGEHQKLICPSCNHQYHAQCQSNVLLCNSCFLKNSLFDLKQETTDPFNLSKEIDSAYFAYLQNDYPYQFDSRQDCIYFHVAKFDLPHLTSVEKKDKMFLMKAAVVDKIFPPGLQTLASSRHADLRDFWDIDDIEYYFYLNHNEVKVNNFISESAVVFKLAPRILQPQNNILVIKAVKKTLRIGPSPTFTPWSSPKSTKKVIMLGVYQTNKIKNPRTRQDNIPGKIKGSVQSVTWSQALCFLQYVLKMIHGVQYQMVDLNDISSGQKIVTPVRSYGCTHIQCFDYEQFKCVLRPRPIGYKSKQITKKAKVPLRIQIDDEGQADAPIDLDSSSVQIIQATQESNLIQAVVIPPRKMTPEQRRREFLKKKRQRDRKQKKEKDSIYCPICNKKMLSLYFDPIFHSMLISSGFHSKAKLDKNGNFNFFDDKKAITQ